MSLVTASQKLTKRSGENRQFSMDFSNVLSTGETISTQTVTATLECGDASGLTINNLPSNSNTCYC